MNSTAKHIIRDLSRNFTNIPGWCTKRKIVVIESDDWGSIRMPSEEVYRKFVEKGYKLAESDYNRLDALESNNDLEMLFNELSSHRDSVGNHPVITANTIVGNPDFDRIRQSDFTEYHFEDVVNTLQRYKGRDRVLSLWRQGYSEQLFHPQFHGREHVNISRWMKALRSGRSEIRYTFDNETTFSGDADYNFMEVLDFDSHEEVAAMKASLVEGLNIFEEIFGYRSKSFIPPCYAWSSDIEEVLFTNGVKYIQGLIVQTVPTGNAGKYRRKYHFMGSRNRIGQYFLVRNCFFEPSLSKSGDVVDECLNRVNIAFRWNKPAVICSHRINFTGSIDRSNREENLRLLNSLISSILRKWPSVEFMSSTRLGDIIAGVEN
jgi:hypothetical protein